MGGHGKGFQCLHSLFSKQFRFRPRNQHPIIHVKIPAEEAGFPCQVLQRIALHSLRQQGFKCSHCFFRKLRIPIQPKFQRMPARQVGKEQCPVHLGVRNFRRLQAFCCIQQQHARGHA